MIALLSKNHAIKKSVQMYHVDMLFTMLPVKKSDEFSYTSVQIHLPIHTPAQIHSYPFM